MQQTKASIIPFTRHDRITAYPVNAGKNYCGQATVYVRSPLGEDGVLDALIATETPEFKRGNTRRARAHEILEWRMSTFDRPEDWAQIPWQPYMTDNEQFIVNVDGTKHYLYCEGISVLTPSFYSTQYPNNANVPLVAHIPAGSEAEHILRNRLANAIDYREAHRSSYKLPQNAAIKAPFDVFRNTSNARVTDMKRHKDDIRGIIAHGDDNYIEYMRCACKRHKVRMRQDPRQWEPRRFYQPEWHVDSLQRQANMINDPNTPRPSLLSHMFSVFGNSQPSTKPYFSACGTLLFLGTDENRELLEKVPSQFGQFLGITPPGYSR